MLLPVPALLVVIVLTGSCLQATGKKGHRRSKSESKRNAMEINNGYGAALQEQPSYSAPQVLRHNNPAPPPQIPPVLNALDVLRGRPPLTAKEATDVIAYATGGKDFPAYLEIPKTYFSCESLKAGFYADMDAHCQVYHRCDISGKLSSYLCPVKTLFNQITLICDWFYNVNCMNSRQFVDYSNSRLYYPQWHILDTQPDYIAPYVQPVSQAQYAAPPQIQYAAPPQQQEPPPPQLYPGKPSNQMYSDRGNINGHENPEYQMSVVIRNPTYLPDYNAGESNLVPSKEQLDQGSTVAPPAPNAGSPTNSNSPMVETRAGNEKSKLKQQNNSRVNVSVSLDDPSQMTPVRIAPNGNKLAPSS